MDLIHVGLIGAGQLGSRYLQGLKYYSKPLHIFVIDPLKEALQSAQKRWDEVVGLKTPHTLNWFQSLSDLPKEIDLVIISSTADSRVNIVKQLVQHRMVRYWVLEKVLAQSPEQIKELQNVLSKSLGIWVNFARRMMLWHQQLKKFVSRELPVKVYVGNSSWGLASNSVHLLDLISWWSAEDLVDIDVSDLNSDWMQSKRTGFWEVTGILRASYSGGSELSLESLISGEDYQIHIKSPKGQWIIEESEGKAHGPGGVSLYGRMELQSEMTARLVESILETGKSDLPSLDESANIHLILLHALREHWNQNSRRSDNFVPIT